LAVAVAPPDVTQFTEIVRAARGFNRTGRIGKSAAFGADSAYRTGAPRSMKTGNTRSLSRYDVAEVPR
jgi:hypothetical protein